MDTYDIFPLVGFNVAIAIFLYVALACQIGQLRDEIRDEIRRFAKRKRPGRRRGRSEPDASR